MRNPLDSGPHVAYNPPAATRPTTSKQASMHHIILLFVHLYAFLLVAATLPAPIPVQQQAPAAPPAVAPLEDRPFGLNTHLATRYPELASMATAADRLEEAGVGWAREDVHWWRVQPTATTWDWSFTDEAFRQLIRRDIKIVAVLGHPPGWATRYAGDQPDGISFYEPDPQQFARFARAVVERYGAYVDHWEIWNEPDNPLFWLPAPNARNYAELLKASAKSIRAVDPDAQIILGGVNPFDTTFLHTIAEAGAWDSFDILAIHPYVDPLTPETGNIAASVDGIRALTSQYGARPIWATEVGWSSGKGDNDPVGLTSADQQADYLIRSTLLLWQAGVERIFWYTLKDDPGNPYGLFTYGTGRADFSTPKPVFYAFQTMTRELGGARFVAKRDMFSRTSAYTFDQFGLWRRGDQPYGTITEEREERRGGSAARLSYSFPTSANDYVVFVKDQPVPISGQPYALSLWVYGDGSANLLRLWLRDAEGELLQYTLGQIGPKGWHQLQAILTPDVPVWDRVSSGGNGHLDAPFAFAGLVVDDASDVRTGSGSIIVDDLTALSGPEAYNIALQRGTETIDVVWAAQPMRARLSTDASDARVVSRQGSETTVTAQGGKLRLGLGPSPLFVHHTRTEPEPQSP